MKFNILATKMLNLRKDTFILMALNLPLSTVASLALVSKDCNRKLTEEYWRLRLLQERGLVKAEGLWKEVYRASRQVLYIFGCGKKLRDIGFNVDKGIIKPMPILSGVKMVSCGYQHIGIVDYLDNLWIQGRESHFEFCAGKEYKSGWNFIRENVAKVDCDHSSTLFVDKNNDAYNVGIYAGKDWNSTIEYLMSNVKDIFNNFHFVALVTLDDQLYVRHTEDPNYKLARVAENVKSVNVYHNNPVFVTKTNELFRFVCEKGSYKLYKLQDGVRKVEGYFQWLVDTSVRKHDTAFSKQDLSSWYNITDDLIDFTATNFSTLYLDSLHNLYGFGENIYAKFETNNHKPTHLLSNILQASMDDYAAAVGYKNAKNIEIL